MNVPNAAQPGPAIPEIIDDSPAFNGAIPEGVDDEGPEYLDLAVSDTSENPPVQYLKDGSTVRAKIYSVAQKVGKKIPHRPMLEIILEAADHPGVDVIRDYPNLPFKGSEEHGVKADTELQRRKKVDAIRAFYNCFRIPDRTKYEDMRGLEGWVVVKVEDSPEYGLSQGVAQYLLAPQTTTQA